MRTGTREKASLEHLIESEDLGVEILHPGGLSLTRELAKLCDISNGVRVLEIASGTGESACLLAGELSARVIGLDASAHMVQRAHRKAELAGVTVDWVRGNAHTLPFQDGSFDVVISECAICHLDKRIVLREMLRILRPGGAGGIHDLCWQPDAPQELQAELVDLEEEEPETAAGWLSLFQELGFAHVEIHDRSALIPNWARETRAQIGVGGYLRAVARVLRRWGVAGLWRILAAERIFASPHLGYVIVVGHKPG